MFVPIRKRHHFARAIYKTFLSTETMNDVVLNLLRTQSYPTKPKLALFTCKNAFCIERIFKTAASLASFLMYIASVISVTNVLFCVGIERNKSYVCGFYRMRCKLQPFTQWRKLNIKLFELYSVSESFAGVYTSIISTSCIISGYDMCAKYV